MEGLSYIIGIGLVGFLIFMAIRGVNLWYFRINDIIKLHQESNALLKKLVEKETKQ